MKEVDADVRAAGQPKLQLAPSHLHSRPGRMGKGSAGTDRESAFAAASRRGRRCAAAAPGVASIAAVFLAVVLVPPTTTSLRSRRRRAHLSDKAFAHGGLGAKLKHTKRQNPFHAHMNVTHRGDIAAGGKTLRAVFTEGSKTVRLQRRKARSRELGHRTCTVRGTRRATTRCAGRLHASRAPRGSSHSQPPSTTRALA